MTSASTWLAAMASVSALRSVTASSSSGSATGAWLSDDAGRAERGVHGVRERVEARAAGVSRRRRARDRGWPRGPWRPVPSHFAGIPAALALATLRWMLVAEADAAASRARRRARGRTARRRWPAGGAGGRRSCPWSSWPARRRRAGSSSRATERRRRPDGEHLASTGRFRVSVWRKSLSSDRMTRARSNA